MNHLKVAKGTFLLTAVYDLLLGFIFLFCYKYAFELLGITLPTYPEYLQMSAAFVFVLGIGYLFIYLHMERNRDLWILGILYKVAYAALVYYYYFVAGTANPAFLYLAIIDTAFLVPMLLLYPKVYKKK
jgi:peptidoglycan/LPS O-acetylase OafA/YrhL